MRGGKIIIRRRNGASSSTRGGVGLSETTLNRAVQILIVSLNTPLKTITERLMHLYIV
jgi:hypothetical protein